MNIDGGMVKPYRVCIREVDDNGPVAIPGPRQRSVDLESLLIHLD